MEDIARISTLYISHSLEIASALVIAVGFLVLLKEYLQSVFKARASLPDYRARVNFGSSVAVSLELLLGADVLATAVAPSWDDIGKLAAIAVIRTTLNYFLAKELKEIRVSPAK